MNEQLRLKAKTPTGSYTETWNIFDNLSKDGKETQKGTYGR